MTTNKIRVGQMGQAYRIKSANINIRDVKEEKEEDGNFEKLPQELPPQQS